VSGAPEYFVYYRVKAAEVPRARVAVETFQAAWTLQYAGGRARWLRRMDVASPAADSDPIDPTWMEIYAGAAVEGEPARAALETALQAGPPGCAAWTLGARHLEIFAAG